MPDVPTEQPVSPIQGMTSVIYRHLALTVQQRNQDSKRPKAEYQYPRHRFHYTRSDTSVVIHIHHPSKSPNPSFRFFLVSAPDATGSCGLLRDKYLPTLLPVSDPNIVPLEPSFSPNQFMSSRLSSSVLSGCSASALFASFFARRLLYSSKGS